MHQLVVIKKITEISGNDKRKILISFDSLFLMTFFTYSKMCDTFPQWYISSKRKTTQFFKHDS